MGGCRGEVWAAGIADAVLNSMVIPSGACSAASALAALGDFDEAYAYSTDIEYFARAVAPFDMVLVRSPQVVEYRLLVVNQSILPPGVKGRLLTSPSSHKRSQGTGL